MDSSYTCLMDGSASASVTRNGMPRYYVEKLSIFNFRKFEKMELPLARRFTLLVGRNGAGKSCLIDALQIGLSEMVPYHDGGYDIPFRKEDAHERYFKAGTQLFIEPQFPAKVQIDAVVDGESTTWSRTRTLRRTTTKESEILTQFNEVVKASILNGGEAIIPIVASYGISRLSWGIRTKPKFLKPSSRFMAITNSLDASEDFDLVLDWWKTQEYESLRESSSAGFQNSALDAVKKAVLGCVDHATEAIYDFKSEQLLVKVNETWTSLSQASSGYKQFLLLVASLAWRAALLNPTLDCEQMLRVPGIVIIDEIDAHLHPEWQRKVVYDLLQTFPNIQFVASTHSPFIIQGLPPAEETSIFRLDDNRQFSASDRTLEEVAEDVQLLSNVERGYAFEQQAAKLAGVLDTRTVDPVTAASRIEHVLSEEPLDAVTKALLELKKLSIGAGKVKP